jgi:hypothetical protein
MIAKNFGRVCVNLERIGRGRIAFWFSKWRSIMRKLALFVMAAGGFATIAPVTGFSVAQADPGMKVAQLGVEIRTDRDREYREHHRRDCREITIRERRGDDVVVRHEQRCD